MARRTIQIGSLALDIHQATLGSAVVDRTPPVTANDALIVGQCAANACHSVGAALSLAAGP
ncbi:MAG: hypothetical protein ABI903_07765 [Actinomycetota bacterium]